MIFGNFSKALTVTRSFSFRTPELQTTQTEENMGASLTITVALE